MVWHPHNVGYGGNQKTCYLEALQRGADVVVMLHPDGQYEPEPHSRDARPDPRGEADFVLGSRFAEPGMARAGGMPLWKYVANRCLTRDREPAPRHAAHARCTPGYRAYSRELLLEVPFLRNSLDFSFDSEMIMQAVHFGFRDHRGAGPLALLRRRVVDLAQAVDRLRDQDALGRRAPAPSPQQDPALAQIQAMTAGAAGPPPRLPPTAPGAERRSTNGARRLPAGAAAARHAAPRPPTRGRTTPTLDRAYADWYRPSSGRFSGAGRRGAAPHARPLARRLDALAPPGPVLDVGAGDGALLDALHRAAGKLSASSATPRAADVRAAELAEIDERFAAIVFWHSLEHLRDPRRGAGASGPAAPARRRDRRGASPTPPAFRRGPSATAGSRSTCPATSCTSPKRHCERLRGLGLAVERVSHLRGGQIVFGWLHGLVGLLPGRPDLYDAIRRPAARRGEMGRGARAATLLAGAALVPVAALLARLEVALRRGGTVYVEARRP